MLAMDSAAWRVSRAWVSNAPLSVPSIAREYASQVSCAAAQYRMSTVLTCSTPGNLAEPGEVGAGALYLALQQHEARGDAQQHQRGANSRR